LAYIYLPVIYKLNTHGAELNYRFLSLIDVILKQTNPEYEGIALNGILKRKVTMWSTSSSSDLPRFRIQKQLSP